MLWVFLYVCHLSAIRPGYLFLSVCACVFQTIVTNTSLKCSQTLFTTETFWVLHISCIVWQTTRHAGGAQRRNTDVSSNFTSHCATVEGEEERRVCQHRTVWKVQRKNENGGGGVEGKKSLSQQKFSLKFWDKWSLCPSPVAAWGVMLFLCK